MRGALMLKIIHCLSGIQIYLSVVYSRWQCLLWVWDPESRRPTGEPSREGLCGSLVSVDVM